MRNTKDLHGRMCGVNMCGEWCGAEERRREEGVVEGRMGIEMEGGWNRLE